MTSARDLWVASIRRFQWPALLALILTTSVTRAETNTVASVADPANDEPADAWVDRMNDVVFRMFERPVEILDGWFATAKEKEENQRLRNSTFRLRLNLEIREESGAQFSFEPDYTLDFHLPHLNRRMHFLVRSTDIDDLPDETPSEEENSVLVGVGTSVSSPFWGGFSIGGGVKVRTPLEPYVSAGWRREMRAGELSLIPQQRVFWSGDDGFGELTTLRLIRPMGERVLALTTTGVKWGEQTPGVEWSQSAMLRWYWRGYKRRDLNRHPMLGLKGVLRGHKSGEFEMDAYRAESILRYPLRKRWLFLDIIPFVEWKPANQWRATPGIWVALDIFFDGSAVTRPVALSGEDYPALELDPEALDE